MNRESEESTSQYVSNSTTRDTHSSGVMNMTKVENCACLTNGGMSRGDDSRNNGLVRIYDHGETLVFDRMEKVNAFECMSRSGQGSRLLGRFPNGWRNEENLVEEEEWTPSETQTKSAVYFASRGEDEDADWSEGAEPQSSEVIEASEGFVDGVALCQVSQERPFHTADVRNVLAMKMVLEPGNDSKDPLWRQEVMAVEEVIAPAKGKSSNGN
ncbi:hypothetical protein SUGI_0184270 [Cryptomeria japonica]|nr:hypothetical protein SUGI_0184270 [Cryptomeria japonica]